MTTLQIRVEDDIKQQSDILFKKLGMDTTTAIRVFLNKAIDCQGIPFDLVLTEKNPFAPKTEKEILIELDLARKQIAEGQCSPAEEVYKRMKEKYGL